MVPSLPFIMVSVPKFLEKEAPTFDTKPFSNSNLA